MMRHQSFKFKDEDENEDSKEMPERFGAINNSIYNDSFISQLNDNNS